MKDNKRKYYAYPALDSYKNYKGLYKIIDEVYSEDSEIIFGCKTKEESKEEFKTRFEEGAAKYKKVFRKKIKEIKEDTDLKFGTNFFISCKVTFTKTYLTDNSVEQVNRFVQANIDYFKDNFDLICASRKDDVMLFIAVATFKRSYGEENIKERLKEGYTLEELNGVLSYALIFPSSYTARDGSSYQITSYSNFQEDYAKTILKKFGFTRKVITVQKERVALVNEDNLHKEIEALNTRIKELEDIRDKNIKTIEELSTQVIDVKVIEHENEDIQKLRNFKNNILNYIRAYKVTAINPFLVEAGFSAIEGNPDINTNEVSTYREENNKLRQYRDSLEHKIKNLESNILNKDSFIDKLKKENKDLRSQKQSPISENEIIEKFKAAMKSEKFSDSDIDYVMDEFYKL